MSFGWNLFQTLQINSTTQKADQASMNSHQNKNDVARLEDRIDALSLACHAMWEILKEKHDVTTHELENKIEQLDLMDGKADGKLKNTATNCPDCGHKLSKRHSNCFYCGSAIPGGGIFHKG